MSALARARRLTMVAAMTLVSPVFAGDPQPVPASPSFVIVQLDDWSATSLLEHLNGDPGSSGVPTLEQLAIDLDLSVARFFSCFVAQPACAPSRVSLLRGQWTHRTGIRRNQPVPPESLDGGLEGYVGRGLHLENLATWLDDAGYKTAHIGKFLNYLDGVVPSPPVPAPDELGIEPLPGWDEWHSVQRYGIGGYLWVTLSRNGSLVDLGPAYSTDVYRDIAVDIIEDTPLEEPLFLHFCPSAPHAPALPATRHEGRRPGVVVPRPPQNPAWLEPDVSDKPSFIQGRPLAAPEVIDTYDSLYRDTSNCLSSVSEAIVALLQALDRTGRLESTLVLVTSDNGWSFLDHRTQGKGETYLSSIRVPLLVVGKNRNMVATGIRMQLVSYIDITATLVDLSGATVSPGYRLDGVSFASVLADPFAPSARRDTLVLSGVGRSEPSPNPLRRPDWASLVTAVDHPELPPLRYSEYSNGEKELYFLRSDPFELENAANDPRHEELLQVLAARLAELRQL
jgi:arylsulfatase A-like enzyme